MNVHKFDGQLPRIAKSSLSVIEKKRLFSDFRERLVTEKARYVISIIITDMTRTDGRNFDEKSTKSSFRTAGNLESFSKSPEH